MSSLALARKYRPRTFAEMAGQEHVVRALTNAIERGRLHHAYLFTGTRGVGKTTVSRILAKSLNCTGPDGRGDITARPCGVCPACTEIDADRYVDYLEMDAASNRSIEEIRDLIERAAYKPAVGRFKVFMIDEAHQLTKDAFNALLKTLEEPPAYLKFVLATTDPERMLPTVLSRCLQFNLRPMAPQVVQSHLAQVLDAEGVAHDPQALRLLGRAARGSMRDALSLTDQAIAYGGGRLDGEGVRAMLGLVGDDTVDGLLQALAQRDGGAVVAGVHAMREAGLSASSALEQMAQRVQAAAVLQAAPQALADDEAHACASALAEALAPDELQLLYSILIHGRRELALMSDAHAALLMVLLRWLAFADDERGPPRVPAPGTGAAVVRVPPVRAAAAPAADLHEAPVAAPAGAPIPAPTAAPIPAPTPAPIPAPATARKTLPAARTALGRDVAMPPAAGEAPAQPPEPLAEAQVRPSGQAAAQRVAGDGAAAGTLADRWDATVRAMAAVPGAALSGLVRELAWQSTLVAVEDGSTPRWRLRVAHESLCRPASRDKLAQALALTLGVPVALDLEPGPTHDSPSQRDALARERRQREAESEIHDDPLVRELLGQFRGARIVPGSIRPL